MTRFFYIIIGCLLFFSLRCSGPGSMLTPGDHIRSSISACLENDEIAYWYPRVIDSLYGGYTERYSYDWKEDSIQDKYLVYEARHLWTTSMLYRFYPGRPDFLAYAKHGFAFLKNKMWDPQDGGFFLAVDKQGNPMQGLIDEKRIYGQAFAIYSLSEYFLASGDSAALDLARKAFNWIEKKPHDAVYGGYWEIIKRDGTPVSIADSASEHMGDRLAAGYKDYNSSIHLLESLTTLYKAWPDARVQSRLEEMYRIVKDTMVDPNGYLIQFFYGDWKRVPPGILNRRAGNNIWYREHVTFGHDIETAYLLLEAAEALHAGDASVLNEAKKLTDHTIRFGWDTLNGGIFDHGEYIGDDSISIIDNHKSWWAEIEALNTLLLMSEKFPAEKDHYYPLFLKQWEYIERYLIDHQYGEFYNYGIDTDPANKTDMKAHAWKASYHTSRGLVNCIKMLSAGNP